MIAFKLFKSKSGGNDLWLSMRKTATVVKRPVYKALKAGCKKKTTVLYSRAPEH